MAPNLTSGTFNIISLIDGNPPVGVNLTRPSFQFVYLNGPVRTWVVEQEGDTYLFSLGGYQYTGVVDKKVVASIFPEQGTEWIAIYRKEQDAYTILPINDSFNGWTIANESPNSRILLRPIIETGSLPPLYATGQLFRFVQVE